MRFSERQGFRPVRKVLQIDSMDEDLKNRLWNALASLCWEEPREFDSLKFAGNLALATFLPRLWHEFFKKPIDTIPRTCTPAIDMIRQFYVRCHWYEVYDLVEFIADRHPSPSTRSSLIAYSNRVLEEELSGYRFVAGKIIPITSEQEVASVERAIAETASLFPNATEHLRQSINLLAHKPKPDYRNSIKESISAVEALCATVTGDSKATLGQALKVIDPRELHSALRSAFEKLYGYTSDAEGIRHALMEEETLEQEDAVFMLVACSAFISYVIAKQARKDRR
jgi:PAS domain-containing protein